MRHTREPTHLHKLADLVGIEIGGAGGAQVLEQQHEGLVVHLGSSLCRRLTNVSGI